jgi:hypothetical protein
MKYQWPAPAGLHNCVCSYFFGAWLFSGAGIAILNGMWDFKIRSFIHNVRDPDNAVPAIRKGCDIPGCAEKGEYKAPKSRYDLRDYYWFCLEHVRQYNANWDFFKGMTPGEVEQHIQRTTVWDRPTWRMTEAGLNEDRTRQKIYEHFTKGESVFGEFNMDGERPQEQRTEAHIDLGTIPHPTIEALAMLELQPPLKWDAVKTQYKTLVKKYHPDTNKDDKNAEERLKKINLAYSILKLSYQHFTTLEEK